ncbi:nuclease HARBI1, partial [Phenoliferia sp. Uapishka_3]
MLQFLPTLYQQASAVVALLSLSAELEPEQQTMLVLTSISLASFGLLCQAASIPVPLSSIRGPYDILKSADALRISVEQVNDRYFRNVMRMSKPAFQRLVTLLSTDPLTTHIYTPKPLGRPPRPAALQIAACLGYLGCGSSKLRAAIDATIGAGTLPLYLKRFNEALSLLKTRVVRMPISEEEKDEISEGVGIPGCIGVIDGTFIELDSVPHGQHRMDFWCGKHKSYGLNLQAVCDHTGRFISFELGWAGSKNDSEVWQQSELYLDRYVYFAQGPEGTNLLIGDKGYGLSSFLIRSYNAAELRAFEEEEQQDRLRWNVYLASQRIIIEQSFARLKRRFQFLKRAPGYDHDVIWETILSCLLLHNLMMTFGDAVGGMDEWEDDEPVGAPHLSDAERAIVAQREADAQGVAGGGGGGYAQGQALRELLFNDWMDME